MTEQQAARESGLTTEEIASAGMAESDEIRVEQQVRQPVHEVDRGFGDETGDKAQAQLLEGEELDGVITRWRDIQARFVDEPRSAVQDADELVADLMQRLARMFATERDQLESRWTSGEDVSTEDLRQGLRRYRSFFERLLAA
jgi:hypothetical protein